MTHTNRGRITVILGGDWRVYTQTLPAGSEAIGVVSRGEGAGSTGALVHLIDDGVLVQVNAGRVRPLDQRKVHAAVQAAREES